MDDDLHLDVQRASDTAGLGRSQFKNHLYAQLKSSGVLGNVKV
jgi:hypothetical protein